MGLVGGILAANDWFHGTHGLMRGCIECLLKRQPMALLNVAGEW